MQTDFPCKINIQFDTVLSFLLFCSSEVEDSDQWFLKRRDQHKTIIREMEGMKTEVKNMRKKRLALGKATSSFVFSMSEMITQEGKEKQVVSSRMESTRQALEKSTLFHTSMAELHHHQSEADKLVIWFCEDQVKLVKKANEALKMRKRKLRKLWSMKIKKVVDDDPDKEVTAAEEEFEALSKTMRTELGKIYRHI